MIARNIEKIPRAYLFSLQGDFRTCFLVLLLELCVHGISLTKLLRRFNRQCKIAWTVVLLLIVLLIFKCPYFVMGSFLL